MLQPYNSWWILLSLLTDCIFADLTEQKKFSPSTSKTLYRLCLVKNLSLIAWFCVVLPIFYNKDPLVSLTVISLCSIDALTRQQRGSLSITSPVAFCLNSLFLGRLIIGPVGNSDRFFLQLSNIKPSFSVAFRGLMRLITGIAKRVIIVGQLTILVGDILETPQGQITIATAWLTALSCALILYFTLSAYSDIAVGLAMIFSIELRPFVYYPFQARGPREYTYRINLPLEDTVGELLSPGFDHGANHRFNWILSLFTPLIIAVWLFPSVNSFIWGLLLALFVAVDWLLLRHIPAALNIPLRIFAFIITLPVNLFLLPAKTEYIYSLLSAMFGIGNPAIYNDLIIYLTGANLLLLIIAVTSSISLSNALSRLVYRQFPRLWWICAVLFTSIILIITTSFMMWNVG